MPGKSRHSRGKRHHQSKKSKAIRRQAIAATALPVTSEMPARATPVAATVPSPKPVENTAARYPYVTGELKRTGILAAIIIVILIILSVTIS